MVTEQQKYNNVFVPQRMYLEPSLIQITEILYFLKSNLLY